MSRRDTGHAIYALYAVFVNFKVIFDSEKRDKVMSMLAEVKVSTNMLNLLTAIS